MRRSILKLIMLLVGFNLIFYISFSQESTKIDSLKKLITQVPDDSAKVNLLLKLFWEYRRIKPDIALEYANQSLILAEKIEYTLGVANSIYQIGIINKVQGNYFEAAESFQKAIKYYEKILDTLGVVACYTDLGDIYNRQNDYEKALKYLDQARRLVILTGDREKLSRIYNMLGGMYNSQKQYEKALEYHMKSLELNEELNFKLGMSVNYNNIGNVYVELKEFAAAKENYLKSLEIKQEINDAIGIASSYNNLGLISTQQKKFTDAIEYHNRALAKYSEIDDKSGIAMCYVNIANAFLEAGNPEKAIDFASRSIEITKSYDLKKIQTEVFRILADAYARLQSYEKAYYYQRQYKVYSDSIQSLEEVRQITEMESRFESEKKEKEIAVLNAENEKQDLKLQKQRSQRNLMIGFTAFVLIILVILIWNFRNKQKINKKLEELNLTKSRFFANLSHEFRTPLTLLLGPLEKLLKNPKQEEKELIQLMHRNATRLLFLDNQLLELSKLESGSLKLEVSRSDITQALKGMVMSFQSLAEKRNIDFKFSFPDKEIQAFFDLDKLEKIVYNLLSNALKFTPEKGTVLFELTQVWEKTNKQLPSKIKKLQGQVICISVRDTGPGISKEHVQKIFDRFYQVDAKLNRKFEGTGLGLSLSKELADLHRGSLQVESEPGKGSAFSVFLPIDRKAYALDEIVETQKEQLAAVSIDNNKYRSENTLTEEQVDNELLLEDNQEDKMQILIVEDNPDMRIYIRDCFDSRYDIIEAGDGKAGFDTATNTMPDLIISDLMMPEMDGIELCKQLKTDERTSHIPVILLTALASVEDRIRGLETGADDYIAKPFNRQELQTRTQNLIYQRIKLIERFSKSVRLEPKDIAITSIDEQFIKKLIERIEKNLSDPDFSIEALIDEANLSRSQLHRKLKALTGMSATEFIRSIRLKRAAQLLEQHYGTIAETVYAVGFNNLSYFSKCFQKQFGSTPKEYIDRSNSSKLPS